MVWASFPCQDLSVAGGAFWHGHDCARGARVPVQNRAYWTKKIAGNKARDKDVQAALTAAEWEVVVLPELCTAAWT